MKPTKLILVSAVALTLSACADMKVTPSPVVPDGRVATPESALVDAVRWELGTMDVRGLTVTVKDGEVTLKGDVASGQQLARIAKAVQAVPGVRAVIPDVNVKN